MTNRKHSPHRSIGELIEAAGGEDQVAKATGYSVWGVRRWKKIGIPLIQWDVFIKRAGASADELYQACLARKAK